MTALYGDHIQVAVRPGDRYKAENEDGQLKILAVCSSEHLETLPDVPTVKEAIGVDCEVYSFRGWWAPAGIPENRLQIIREAFDKVMADPEIQQKITDAVAQFAYTPGDELGDRMAESIENWRVMLPKLEEWAKE